MNRGLNIFVIAVCTAQSPSPKSVEKFSWPKTWGECELLPLSELVEASGEVKCFKITPVSNSFYTIYTGDLYFV